MDYKVLITKIGLAKFTNFAATKKPVELQTMAIGDGGGQPVEPNQNQTALVRETTRQQINTITKDPNNDAQFIIEGIIPEDVGNFYIREAGVFDKEGDLIAIANYPESYKPLMAEGSGKAVRIRLIIEVSNAAAVTLKIDPSVVLASREYVDVTIGNRIDDLKIELAKISIFQYSTLPATKLGDIIYVEPFGFMKWNEKWKMYRSINAAKPERGWGVNPDMGFMIGDGSYYSKHGNYKGLWTAALDGELVLPPENWHVGQYIFIDVDENTFRVPDVRGYHSRNASLGSNVDPGRIIFSGQDDAFQGHFHNWTFVTSSGSATQPANAFCVGDVTWTGNKTMNNMASTRTSYMSDGANGDVRIANETRGKNTAYPPWIKF